MKTHPPKTTLKTKKQEKPKTKNKKPKTLLDRVVAIHEETVKLDRAADKIEERLDRLSCVLSDLIADIAGGSLVVPSLSSRPRGLSPKAGAKKILARIAMSGVRSLDIYRSSDGYGVVTVDFGQSFSLTPKLTDLLEILASPEGTLPSADDFPPWKDKSDITRRLSKKYGYGHVTEHSVVQNLSRLKRSLTVEGVNPALIQTDRFGQYRFLVRQ